MVESQPSTIFELIGWLAFGLNVLGNLALTKKSAVGWKIRLVCNFVWIIYSYIFWIKPLLANHIIFAGINIYGWREWTKHIYVCACGKRYELPTNQSSCICEMPIRPKVKK